MKPKINLRLLLVSSVIAFSLLAVHEWYFRTFEYWNPGFDDEAPDLWARERGKVDQLAEDDILIIGSSRIHFNTNMEIWDSEVGKKPVMLAVPGSSPYPLVEDIVENTEFKGIWIVGVAPGSFFTVRNNWGANKIRDSFIGYYYDQTYAQKFNFFVSERIEPHLAYLDPDINLTALIDRIPLPDRENVWHNPVWPAMVDVRSDRGIRMIPEMESDTAVQNTQKEIWLKLGAQSGNRYKDSIESIFNYYVPLFNKFRERGGQVVFVSSPVTGPYLENYLEHYPRDKYWDRLIKETKGLGIHFLDHEVLRNMEPPEWSHLNRKDSDTYTHLIIDILRKEEIL